MKLGTDDALYTDDNHSSDESNPKQRYGDRKVPLHLVPPAASIYAALGLREGAQKYGAWNFRDTSVEAMTYIGAIRRHLDAFVDGEDMDPDRVEGLPPKPHLAGAIASLAILIDAYECGYLIDNRPKPGMASVLLKRYEK